MWQSKWNGEISRIRVPGDKFGGANDEVEIIGNYLIQGKGAAWAELENSKIKTVEFDYLIDCMDSIEEAGVMLNVEKKDDTLEGYMICFTSNIDQYVDLHNKPAERQEVLYGMDKNGKQKVGVRMRGWPEDLPYPILFDRFDYSNILIRSMKSIPKKPYMASITVGREDGVEVMQQNDTVTAEKEIYLPCWTQDEEYVYPDEEIIQWVSQYLGRTVSKDDLTGVICKFKYTIGKNNDLMCSEKDELELIDVFNAGSWNAIKCKNDGHVVLYEDHTIEVKQMELTGSMKIEVNKDGYLVTIPSANKEITIPVKQEEMNRNIFGFIAEHYEHGCGFQRIF